MKSSLILAGIVLLYLVIGAVAVEVGLAEPNSSNVLTVPDAPSDGGSLFDKLSAALAPFAWAWSAVSGLLALVTYQTDGVPVLVNTFLLIPLGGVVLFAVIRMIRGVS